MIRSLLLPLLFVSALCTCAAAQNTLAETATDSLTEIRLIARPHGDSIVLRWAPESFAAWTLLRQQGVLIERRRIGTGKGFALLPGERRMAMSLEDIMSFADTSNVHVVATAEALYGAAEPGTQQGAMGRVKDIHEEQSQRLFLALVNADLSTAAADVLGWRFVDRTVEPGYTYEYRLRLPAPDQRRTVPLRLRSDANFYAGPVHQLSIEPGDGKILLRWPQAINGPSFVAYRLEVSDDGQQWTEPSGLPFMPEPAGSYFEHEVKLENNGQERYYRLRGINSFGETCPAGEAVKASGKDQTPPPAPFSINGKDLRDGRNQLQWTIPDEMPEDLAGYRLLRGLSLRGKLEVITTDLLPPGTSSWTDNSPFADRNNYYAVEAVDQAGNAARSPVNFVQRWDKTPPATPLGLTGRIDTAGRVFLLWEAGTEPDLLGYRVYRSHARNREFLQISKEVQHRNFFFDSTSLKVLNETVLYRIVAVDRHYNPSEYSEILELRRPDKIAPAAPGISGYSARGTSILLTIRPSESPDVVRQTVWRAEGEQPEQPIAVIGARDSIFQDTSVRTRTVYRYSIRAEDEVGLFGASRPISVQSGLPTSRKGVQQLARTQVQGKEQEAMRWQLPGPVAEIAGYQLFAGPSAQRLRPAHQLPPETTEWLLPDTHQFYALKVLFTDGSRSPLSAILPPAK
ncbi:fibronectin type III domain-containing protein [Neolewinella agarilytica]|uniref:Fibronectin type-III domain-containing protein n=1 Tax=Neolewinella agarilytica TaxID=478744 RepID=A0A1H9ELW7_9BACT|nr:hypothetical protein [Neolewinella agarilytica]SEQ26726.1 hypothetical protein SAMN05444359_107128 [Neolewinella agarilytica]